MTIPGPDGFDLPLAVVRRDADPDLASLDPGSPGQEWLAGLVLRTDARAWDRMVRHRDVASLYRSLGPSPRDCLRLIPECPCAEARGRRCSSIRGECLDPEEAPACFFPGEGWLGFVVLAWRDGYNVAIVEAPE